MQQHPRVAALLATQNNDAPQKSAAWLEARRGVLTASDVPAVLGQSSFCSPAAVMLRKLGLGASFEGNAATRHGERYEDEAIERYEAERGTVVHRFGLLRHGTRSAFAGSPDGISDDGILLEVKVRSIKGGRKRGRSSPRACSCGRWACRARPSARSRSARGSAGSPSSSRARQWSQS